MPGRIDAFENLQRLLAGIAVARTNQQQQFQKRSGLLAHRRTDPADVVLIRGYHQGRRNGDVMLARLIVVQIVFVQGYLVRQLAKGANDLTVGLGEYVILRFLRKEQQRNIVRHLCEGGSAAD
jgi:hypothetical protein